MEEALSWRSYHSRELHGKSLGGTRASPACAAPAFPWIRHHFLTPACQGVSTPKSQHPGLL